VLHNQGNRRAATSLYDFRKKSQNQDMVKKEDFAFRSFVLLDTELTVVHL
jgi:hypothetical protein